MVSVVLHVAQNKSGIVFRHMSNYHFENEVLLGSKAAKRGWTITGHQKTKNSDGHDIVHIYVTENTK